MASDGLVLGSQLRSARESLALSPGEVAEQLGVMASDVDGWEAGRAEPSVERLSRLAEIYNRSLDYFLRATAPPPRSVHLRLRRHRSMDQVPQEARRVLATFDELCRASFELERVLGRPRRCDLPRPPAGADPATLAAWQRRALSLGERPLPKLRDILERHGVRVFHLPVPGDEFSGFSWWSEEYGPCILVNAKEASGARNFTLGHEWAHLMVGDTPSLCGNLLLGHSREERTADRFATQFLMPEAPIRRDFQARQIPFSQPPATELGRIAGKWGVSLQALGLRLEELKLIARGSTTRLVEEWKREGRSYGAVRKPTWQRRLGERYVGLAMDAYRTGHISLGTLAHYLGDMPLRKAREQAQKWPVEG